MTAINYRVSRRSHLSIGIVCSGKSQISQKKGNLETRYPKLGSQTVKWQGPFLLLDPLANIIAAPGLAKVITLILLPS